MHRDVSPFQEQDQGGPLVVQIPNGLRESALCPPDDVICPALDVDPAPYSLDEGSGVFSAVFEALWVGQQHGDALGMTQIYLDNNLISDLTPLAAMTSLPRVQLANNNVSDLSPLSGLTAVTYLAISSNPVPDATIVNSMPALTTFWANSTGISDTSPLAGRCFMSGVDLRSTSVSCPDVVLSDLADCGVLIYSDC
jgi:Leucine-rich repeat (LRR) protein